MLRLYEKNGLKVDAELVIQYLQNREVARGFALYYDLFNKYRSDYQIDRIYAGAFEKEILQRAGEAKFDEKLSLLGLLLSGLEERFAAVEAGEKLGESLLNAAKELRERQDPEALSALIEREKEALAASRQAGRLSRTEQQIRRRSIALLEKLLDTRPAPEELLPGLRALIAEQRAALGGDAAAAGRALENSFAFCERAFGEGQELLILVTELTADSHSAHFIARYGSEGYYRHNQALLVYERQQTILRELDALETANP